MVYTMVGIPSHIFVTKQQSCLYSIYWFWIYILTSFLSALLEYLDVFKPFVVINKVSVVKG